MAYIVSRRSHNSRAYYLVESYRNAQGQPRLRTLCYLGRDQDGTDTLAKAVDHWEGVRESCVAELASAKGERAGVLKRRRKAVELKLALLRSHAEAVDAKRREKERQAEEMGYWLAFERLADRPSEENARAARRAFLALAKRHHPDQGGEHHAFLRVKQAYDRARGRWELLRTG